MGKISNCFCEVTTSFAKGVGTLIAGAAHPAAYVLLGHSSKFQSKIPEVDWNEVANQEFSFKPKTITDYVSGRLQGIWEGITLDNAQATIYDAGRSLKQLDLRGAYGSAAQAFQNHSFEIQTAAIWGTSSTFANMILKRMPVIRNYPKVRAWIVAPIIGAGVTAATFHFGLKKETNPQIFIDVAIKVGLIGGAWKVANTTTQYLLKATRSSSETVASIVSGGCSLGLGLLQTLDWGGMPKGPRSTGVRSSRDSTPARRRGEGGGSSDYERELDRTVRGQRGAGSASSSRGDRGGTSTLRRRHVQQRSDSEMRERLTDDKLAKLAALPLSDDESSSGGESRSRSPSPPPVRQKKSPKKAGASPKRTQQRDDQLIRDGDTGSGSGSSTLRRRHRSSPKQAATEQVYSLPPVRDRGDASSASSGDDSDGGGSGSGGDDALLDTQ